MELEFKEGGVLVSGEEIRPEIVFDCGQCFRFLPDGDGFSGVARGRVLHVLSRADGFFIYPSTKEDFYSLWKDYFDLGISYADINSRFSGDEIISKAVECSSGMRLLNQEPFETLISFIISANNNIGRIRGIIERICAICGDAIEEGGKAYYAFPLPQQLSGLSVEQLSLCGAGYRAPYIKETAQRIAEGFDLDRIYSMDYGEAKKLLLTLKGIGPKVADCILLFAFKKRNAFPVDVWMKRVLKRLYDFSPKNTADSERFAEEHFGEYAGIAQQYLFNYARLNKLL